MCTITTFCDQVLKICNVKDLFLVFKRNVCQEFKRKQMEQLKLKKDGYKEDFLFFVTTSRELLESGIRDLYKAMQPSYNQEKKFP